MFLLAFLGVFAALLAIIYPLYIAPIITVLGLFRTVNQLGTRDCQTIPALSACEKFVIHRPTGVLYLACSTVNDRLNWDPFSQAFNASGRSNNDYIATYDPSTSKIHKLDLTNFPTSRPIGVHGLDVVPSSTDPKTLYVYMINHRVPLDGQDPTLVGADSSVEIFQTTVGSRKLKHLKTVEDPAVIVTPNDVVGSPDGKSFHFTNDHLYKTGKARVLHHMFTSQTSVGYCHVDEGCKIAIDSLPGVDGITKALTNDTFYISSSSAGFMRVLEKQEDNTLVVTDVVKTDYACDNLFVDDDGAVWTAAFPKMLVQAQHMTDGTTKSPTAVLKLTINSGPGSFYGEKYKLEKVWEDDGTLASGTTTVAYDVRRSKLFLSGYVSPWLTVCKL